MAARRREQHAYLGGYYVLRKMPTHYKTLNTEGAPGLLEAIHMWVINDG